MRKLSEELLIEMRRIEYFSETNSIRDREVCKAYFASFDISDKETELTIEIGANATIFLP